MYTIFIPYYIISRRKEDRIEKKLRKQAAIRAVGIRKMRRASEMEEHKAMTQKYARCMQAGYVACESGDDLLTAFHNWKRAEKERDEAAREAKRIAVKREAEEAE